MERACTDEGDVETESIADDFRSVSTETEDDPVNRAMRAALDDSESLPSDGHEDRGFAVDDEDERILWPPASKPIIQPHARRDTVTADSPG